MILETLEDYQNAIEVHGNKNKAAIALGIIPSTFNRRYASLSANEDIATDYNKVQRSLQKQLDNNRILRKTKRDEFRVETILDNFLSEIKPFNPIKISKHKKENDWIGVLHFSDCHFGQVVDMDSNKYNYEIAEERIHSYVNEMLPIFKLYNVKKIFIAFVGDMINSGRRIDEYLTNEYNCAEAFTRAIDVFSGIIKDLSKDYDLEIATVVGNESRLDKDYGTTEKAATNNYDYMIHKTLNIMFKNYKNIKFHNDSFIQSVVNVDGFIFYLTHGHIGGNITKNIGNTLAKYASQGIVVDFGLAGHLHHSMLSDLSSQGGSTVGSDEYSYKQLGYMSRPSQNGYVVNCKNKKRHGFKIDL